MKFFLHSACKFTVVDYTLSKTQIKSICLTGIAAILLAASCKLKEEKIRDEETWQKLMDSTGNALLDSIYKKESLRLDSLKKIRVPEIVDSILKVDGIDKKLKKIIDLNIRQ